MSAADCECAAGPGTRPTANALPIASAQPTGPNPDYDDLEIARLVHRAMADVQDAGRFRDRKVFIASLWAG